MSDSKTCQFCGGEIHFRIIQGICVPIHDKFVSCVTHASTAQPDSCHQTKCPYCGERVFFVRHNNGAVWFQELGKPWEKHPCFLSQLQPAEPSIEASFSIVRIRNIVKYFRYYGQEHDGEKYSFEVHMGIARCSDIVWYVIPESSPNLTPDEVFGWKGRYCYFSSTLGELVFFNKKRIVLFKQSEV
jgi:hypothetical protein